MAEIIIGAGIVLIIASIGGALIAQAINNTISAEEQTK